MEPFRIEEEGSNQRGRSGPFRIEEEGEHSLQEVCASRIV